MILYSKPSKLGSDDDLVAYLRNLERPLNEACQTVRQAYQTHKQQRSPPPTDSSSSFRKRSRSDHNDTNSTHDDKSNSSSLSVFSVMDDDTRALVLRVYNEIHHREASLATHKKCSFVIEWVLYLSNAVQLIRFGEVCIPYLSFMTSNRYGSHVLQTWLSLVYEYLNGIRDIEELTEEDLESPEMINFTSPNTFMDHNQNNETLNPIQIQHAKNLHNKQEIISALSRTVILWLCILSPYLHSIIYDTSGTHILRSLIGILTGIPTHSLNIVLNNNPTNYTSNYGNNGDQHDITNKPNPSHTKTPRTDDSQITTTIANTHSQSYYQQLPTDVTNTFREAYIRLVHQICNLGNNVTSNTNDTAVSSSSSSSSSSHRTTTNNSNNNTSNIIAPIQIQSRIGNLAIEIPTELIPPNINPNLPSHIEHSPLSSNEELGAMGCDLSASPTIQLLLIGCTDTVAPQTQKYLCYRLINWDYTNVLTKADISGATDLRLNRTIDGDKKKKKKDKKDKSEDDDTEETRNNNVTNTDDSSSSTTTHWLERLCTHNIGSRVVELIIRYCDSTLFTSLMTMYFYGRIAYLAINSAVCHFIIQRLLISAPNKEIVENILKELIPYVGTLYSKKKEGVIWHLVGAAAGSGKINSDSSNSSSGSNHFQQGTLNFANYKQGVSPELQKQLLYTLTACAVVGPISISAPLPDIPEGSNIHPGKKLSRKERDMEADRLNRIEKLAIQTLKPNDSRLIQWILDYQGVRTKAIANDSGLDINSINNETQTNDTTATTSLSSSSSSPSVGCVSSIGVYTLSYLLRFQPDLTRLVIDSVVSVPSTHFITLCMDPSMSRYIIEPLIELPDGPNSSTNNSNEELSTVNSSNNNSTLLYSTELNWVKNKFFSLLKNYFTTLACSRFGGWVITKLFNNIDVKRKSTLVNEIMNDERKITGSGPGGKTFIRTVKLDYFRSNKAGWEASWVRIAQKQNDLADLLSDTATATTLSSNNNKDKPKDKTDSTPFIKNTSSSSRKDIGSPLSKRLEQEKIEKEGTKKKKEVPSSSVSSSSDSDSDDNKEHSTKTQKVDGSKDKSNRSNHRNATTETTMVMTKPTTEHTLVNMENVQKNKKLAPYMEQLGFSLFHKKK